MINSRHKKSGERELREKPLNPDHWRQCGDETRLTLDIYGSLCDDGNREI